MAVAIKVENLSKAYQLGQIGTGTISRDLERWWARTRGKQDPFLKIGEENDRSTKGGSNIVWSLKDIDFEIAQGEAVGIIGRNGAGKSTLLKILSRVTVPTTGTVKAKGRIASLLEVGTGFHPELTGRENIYLNGAILGMRKKEITRKMDEIIDFSGVERYIDTPVKRYSSGMYVRLAFAVAAHLDSEILIVDEVLAVGDAEFQKKCLGKMGEVSNNEGRTILFVSHNMAAIQNLSSTGLMLEFGKIKYSGTVYDTITNYLQSANTNIISNLNERKDRSGNKAVFFTGFEIRNHSGELVNFFRSGEDFTLKILFRNNTGLIKELKVGVGINNQFGERIGHFNNEMTSQLFKNINCTTAAVQIFLPKLPLKHGRYTITLFASVDGEIADWVQEAFFLDVEHGDFYKTGNLLPDGQGDFLIEHKFSIQEFDS